MPVDYKNGKIYTIRNRNDDTLIYVGSTCNTLTKRFNAHKTDSKTKSQRPFYQTIDNWDDWYIELYEEYPCENKEQLNRREGQVIREIGTLNVYIAGRNLQEWRDDNKERVRDWVAKSNEKRSVKYICECGGSTNRKHKKEHENTKKHLKYIEENQK